MRRDRTAIRLKVSSALHLKGITLKSWALSHGYKYNSVQQVLQKYAAAIKRPRHGSTWEMIITMLERETGIEICGDLKK